MITKKRFKNLYCRERYNSPQKPPEFVDINVSEPSSDYGDEGEQEQED
jgi:hypothetical protein